MPFLPLRLLLITYSLVSCGRKAQAGDGARMAVAAPPRVDVAKTAFREGDVRDDDRVGGPGCGFMSQ